MNKPVEPSAEAAKAQMQSVLERQKRANERKGPPSAAVRKDRLTRCINLLVEHKNEFIEALSTDFGSRSREFSSFADIAAGLKYNLYRDPTAGRILSVGAVIEAPTGSKKALQGNGGGEWNFFASAGTRILGSTKAHWISTGGLRQPNNEFSENRLMYWSNHFDYRLNTVKPLFVFTEIHWWNYLSDGGAFPLAVQGGDIFNLGSPGITGDNLVTQAVGSRYVYNRLTWRCV